MVSADDLVVTCVYIRHPPPPQKKKKKKNKKKKKQTKKKTKKKQKQTNKKTNKTKTNVCVSGYINFLIGTKGKKNFNFGKKIAWGNNMAELGNPFKVLKNLGWGTKN